MYSRKYSLKTRYNFSRVLKSNGEFHSPYLIIKYHPSKVSGTPKFGIIASNKFSNKKTDQVKARRIISSAIQENIDKFPKNYDFVFIPKRKFIDKNGKINICGQDISFEINSFLSKVDFSRSE